MSVEKRETRFFESEKNEKHVFSNTDTKYSRDDDADARD